ncbi:MAG: HAMP domain-containing sensor histidine kinase [Oscillospiraceae bacterium]|nr:HAMP domain-containing sensor histidine kinase [Oscillospiraceae bacterium]
MKIQAIQSSLAAKLTAAVLLIAAVCTGAACVLAACVMVDAEVYTTGQSQFLRQQWESVAYWDCHNLAALAANGDTQAAENYCREKNIGSADLSQEGKTLFTYDENPGQWRYSITFDPRYDDSVDAKPVVAALTVTDALAVDDDYAFYAAAISAGYALRYWVYPIGIACAVLAIACFVFLMCAAGRRARQPGIACGALEQIPFDLLTALVGAALLAPLMIGYAELGSAALELVALAIFAVYAAALGIWYCMNFAVRVKLGRWWRNTLLWRIGKGLCRAAKWLLTGAKNVAGNLPLLWKTIVGLGALCFAEFFGILLFYWDGSFLLLCWFLEKLVLIPAALYLALTLRKLQKGGQALAAGDLSYQVDTHRMVWDFKAHGENLNSIAAGMTRAVDERMKSERMKTELITNVSHDIKTPLTSIINYADLIGKEPTDNETIHEYADVLHRQSERLKKLIDDLVEASKASTGNLEVLLAPCEAGVLLTQTAGEYAQRLEERNLALVLRQPDAPVRILADGRRLWRVFDNLMGNIVKYALPGTRVYLTLDTVDEQAVISFKNTSATQLEVDPGALTDRFVRGDSARATEGSGLGLSIAQSLTQLQNGSFSLTVDGDLFKVTLRFAAI